MPRTPAQKKAVADFQKKLEQSRRVTSNLTPSQNLRLIQGRDPRITPSQRLDIIRRSGGGGGPGSPGQAEEIARAEAQKIIAQKSQANAAAQKAAAAKAAAEKILIEKMRRAGISKLAAEKALRGKAIKLNKLEINSLNAREQMRVAAKVRGRGFTQTEANRFIKARGGSISGLRSARRKGFFIESIEEEKMEKSKKLTGGTGTLKGEAGVLTGDPGERIRGLEGLGIRTQREAEALLNKKNKTEKEKAALLALQFSIPIQSALIGAKQLPRAVVDIFKDPGSITKIPGKFITGLIQEGKEIIALGKISKTAALARIGGEVVVIVTTGKVLKVTGKVSGKVLNKVDPFLKRVKKGKIIIKTTGGKITLKVGGTVKKISEPLTKQVRLAGKKVTAVSAQADRLVNIIRTKRIVRKPIPGEANFKPAVKRLLKKFDSGRITKNELIRLQREVPILERSFFADPRGRFRPSRLGAKQKDASLLDVLRGDVTFRSNKPQILVFENVKVAKFPKNLKDVEKALRGGKPLTKSQATRLLNFQSKKTGQFKPVGALTGEPEITLAPGEIIKKVKKVGTALVNGKRVSIVQVKVVKPTTSTKKLIQKAKKGKITTKELKTLRTKLKKESGFDPLIGRRKGPRPRARLPKRILARPPKRIPKKTGILPLPIGIERPPRKARVPKRPPKRPPRKARVPKRPTKRPPKRPPRKPRVPKRPPKRPPKAPPRRARIPPKPPVVPPRLKAKKRKPTRRRKKKQSYKVLARPLKRRKGQKRPKLIKVSKVPLSKQAAKDLRAYIADTSLARTARIKRTKGKPKRPRLKVPKGYAKRTVKKFRTYQIIKGKRKPLPKGKVIERSRNLLDTRQEKRKIGVRRRIKQITRKPVKRKITRTKTIRRRTTIRPKRISTKGRNTNKPLPRRKSSTRLTRRQTPTRRDQMLKNLAKGRRVLAAKRRRR